MLKICFIIILIVELLVYTPLMVFAQNKSEVLPQEVIDTFIEKIGGFDWQKLKSRKETGFVEFEDSKKFIIDFKNHNRTKVNLYPGNLMDMHLYLTGRITAYVAKPKM